MKACYEPSPSPCATRTTYQAISRIVHKDIHDASISGGSWAAQLNLVDGAPVASPRQWLCLWRRSSMVKVRSGPKAQQNIQTPLWPLCCSRAPTNAVTHGICLDRSRIEAKRSERSHSSIHGLGWYLQWAETSHRFIVSGVSGVPGSAVHTAFSTLLSLIKIICHIYDLFPVLR